MTRQLLRSIGIAFIVGALAAVPLILSFVTGSDVFESLPRLIAVLPVLVCPPWQLFWMVMGHPDDSAFVLRISGAVLILNAFLYAPLGVAHALTLGRSPAVRLAFVGVACVAMLGLGHLIFSQEPASLYALLMPRSA